MKKILLTYAVMMTVILAISCSAEEEWSDGTADWNQQINSMGGGSASSAEALFSGLTDMTVDIDKTALSETETIPSDDEDYIENNSFDAGTIKIAYNGSSAAVTGSVEGVTVTVDNADVTVNSTVKGVAYEVSGTTTDGFLKIYSDKKFQLTLNGADIKNPAGAAINIQSGKRCYVVLADGSSNTLTDGSTYSDATDSEDMKATFFSEGELLFSGSGSLEVYANCKNGICSDDYIMFRPGNNIYVKSTASNCIKSNDGIFIKGGVINVETSATASKGMKTDGQIVIDGGRTTAVTSGNAEYDSDDKDVTGAAAMKCDSTFVMNDGELCLKSTGKGGKGLSGDMDITINGGTVKVITTGATYSYSSSLDSKAKGIKADGNIAVNGGSVMVKATGGDGSEGIESKGTMTITAGTVASYAYDDAINSSKALTISGGYVMGCGEGNDGIDSNSTISISGGVVIGIGTTQPEDGIDCDQNNFAITGGTVIGIGGGTSTPTSNSCKQPSVIVGAGSITSGQYITLADSKGNNILAFRVPRAYNSCTVLISDPQMSTGDSYTIASGATVASSSDDFYGYISNATVSGEGTTIASLSLSSMVTTYNASTGMGGGGMPGTGMTGGPSGGGGMGGGFGR